MPVTAGEAERKLLATFTYGLQHMDTHTDQLEINYIDQFFVDTICFLENILSAITDGENRG